MSHSTTDNGGMPDVSQYIHLRTISKEELSLEHANRRVVIVGDM